MRRMTTNTLDDRFTEMGSQMTVTELSSTAASAEGVPSDDIGDEARERLRAIVAAHGARTPELIQILHEAQALLGYLPREALALIAEELGLPYSRVRGVVTFYSLFTTTPRGRHAISVCLGTACYVRGGQDVLAKLSDTLGIEADETTPDRRFSLGVVRCVGACGLAPVVTVGDDVHKRVNPNKLDNLVERYE